MIVVASLGHRPDDERIYHRELMTLKTLGLPITYFTRSSVAVDLSHDLIQHTNFPGVDRKTYITAIQRTLTTPVRLFHFHEFELLPLARWLKRRYATYTIYDVHEYLREMWDTHSRRVRPVKTMINLGLSAYERRYLSSVDHIIFANNMVAGNPYPSHAGRLTVLENFPLKERIMNRPHQPRLIYHGQLSRARGTDVLLQAFEIIFHQEPSLELELIGPAESPAYREHIQDRINASPARDNIILENEIPHDKIWPRISQASLGIVPFLRSSLTEAITPTKLFEYMAAGCGVVASDLRPLRQSGLDWISLAEPGNPHSLAAYCLDLLQNQNQLEEQIKKNQEWIRTVGNWEAIQDRLLHIYRSALK